jgi:hypothetical protein
MKSVSLLKLETVAEGVSAFSARNIVPVVAPMVEMAETVAV